MTAVKHPEEPKNSDALSCNMLFVSHCQFYVYCLCKKYVHNFVTYYI